MEVINNSKKCRTCLSTNCEMVTLDFKYAVCDKVMSVLELLQTCTNVKIEINDEYPQSICKSCLHSAEKCYEFRTQCENADIQLRSQSMEVDPLGEIIVKTEEPYNLLLNDQEEDSLIKFEDNFQEDAIENIETLDTYSCSLCDFIFTTPYALQRHKTVKHSEVEFFQCRHCSVQFITEDLLTIHEAKHILNSEESETVSTINNIKQNINNNNNKEKEEVKNQCKFCSQIFKNSIELVQHVSSIHKPQVAVQVQADINIQNKKIIYKCKICAHENKDFAKIENHIKVTHKTEPTNIQKNILYKCFRCKTDYISIYQYIQHITKHNDIHPTVSRSNVVRRRKYKCSIYNCDQTFFTMNELKLHKKTHDSYWPKSCQYCGEMLDKIQDYVTHLNNKHEDLKKCTCEQCGKKFFTEKNLKNHLSIHTGERKFMCDYCGFSFKDKHNLNIHRRIHENVRPYKCTYCEKTFVQHSSLKSHLVNHTGEKLHECQECHKKFSRLASLKKHLRIHTGEKRYACHVCGVKFRDSSTRKFHLLTHTGERNHKCDFCGKGFSRKTQLTVHRKIHTGETPNICHLCGKGFIQKHVLLSHLETHRKYGGEIPLKRQRTRTKNVIKSVDKETTDTEQKAELNIIPNNKNNNNEGDNIDS